MNLNWILKKSMKNLSDRFDFYAFFEKIYIINMF